MVDKKHEEFSDKEQITPKIASISSREAKEREFTP